MLHLVPRILMGLLAIVDTFILFKIVERRYSIILALIAAIFFAIMPSTWLFRRVYLETILMPFLLSSILFALYLKEPKNTNSLNPKSRYEISKYVLILLSGIFLGLAIYTKIPAFTMIPLVGTLVYFYSGKNVRSLGIWLIPVISIPLLWPLYSIVVGQTDLWAYWVLWQVERDRPLSISLANFFTIDPLLVSNRSRGSGVCCNKKRFFPTVVDFSILDIFLFCRVGPILSSDAYLPCLLYFFSPIDRVYTKIYCQIFSSIIIYDSRNCICLWNCEYNYAYYIRRKF